MAFTRGADMKYFSFFLAIFLHCLRLNAFEYSMLPNATLQSQTINSSIGTSLDCLLEKSLLSVCVVSVEHSSLLKQWWYGSNPGGAGFFISPQGHLITNKHVIEGYSNPTIFLSFSDRHVKASIIAKHPTEDIALLKIDDLENLSFSYFEISSIPGEIGDWVFCPRAKGICLWSSHLLIFPSLGKIVGETNDPFTILSMGCAFGNSGSPVLNLEGSVIGVMTQQPRLSEGNTEEDIGATLITPINKFKDWIREYL
jgi:S1-C subfamily serine protease